ncbi:hypothetical protein OAD26_00630, partial [bacterium]|nr:hypothetical protein [bacterium]
IGGTLNDGLSDFNNISFSGAGTKTFTSNASTTDFTVASGATVVAPEALTVGRNYTNNGTSTFGSGRVYLHNTETEVGWNPAAATVESTPFSVATEDLSPTGIFFKPDGTKMYVIGSTGDDVNTYTLSTPWDVTTASFDGSPFSVATEDLSPTGIFFKPDGTKMYVIGSTGDEVNPYTLSTAWDVTSATFDGSPFSVATEETGPTGLFFKPDGTKMYVIGSTGDDVNTYTLSTAWDVTSATFDGSPFSVATEETLPYGLFFKPDGTKMYVIGAIGDDVNTYTLSTAWDVISASFDGVPFSVSTEETNPQGIFFKPDGTKMYVIGSTGDDVNTYATDGTTQILSGTMTGTSAFNDVEILTVATTTFSDNASTTDLTIAAGTTIAPTILDISGDYTNNARFDANGGTVLISSTTAPQTLSGTMTGSSTFNNLTILNTATTTFANVASTTGTLFNNTAGSAMVFPASATSTFTNIDIQGTSGNEIYLRSSSDGTQWGIVVTGTQYASYLDVKDSNACDGDTITHISSTVVNSTCWTAGSFVTISGTLYSDEGSTQITDGRDLVLVVGSSNPSNIYATSTDGGAGTFAFSEVFSTSLEDGTPIVVFVDGVSTTKAVTVTKASSSNSIPNVDLYQDTVIVKHESTAGTASTTIADMAIYDSTNDSDIRYTASSIVNTLQILVSENTQEFHVWTGDTFTTSGEVTLRTAVGNSSALHVDDSATLNLGATTTAMGSVSVDTGATLVAPDTTFSVYGDYTNNGTFTHSSGTLKIQHSEGWDVTTAVLDGSPFSVATEETGPTGLFFKPDGTKMYVVGNSGDDVNTYT